MTSDTLRKSDSLKAEVETVVTSHKGKMGVFIKHLGTGETVEINSDELFPTASTIKTAVMCAAFEQLANGTGPYDSYFDSIPYDEATSASGSGFIQNYKSGTKLELKELIHLMITVSDNTATNMLCGWIGLEKVNQWLERKGFEQTRMFSTVGGGQVFDVEGRKTWGLGVTTPEEMGRLMIMIVDGKAGSTSTTEEMLRVLGHQYFDGSIAAGVPPLVYVGSKGGALNRSRSDVGIVASPGGNYVVSVFTKDNEDASWGDNNQAELAIREISKIVWRHYNPELPRVVPEGAL